MKKFIKVSLITIGVLIILFVALFLLPQILGLVTSDVSNVNETGLQIEERAVLPSNNAFFDLEESAKVINLPKENIDLVSDFISGKSWNEKLISDLILGNTNSLSYFSNASRKTTLIDPTLNDLSKINTDTVLPSLNEWRNISKISTLKALSLSKKGLHKEAIEESLKSVRVGQLIMDSTQTVIGHLVGHAIKNQGLNSLDKILASSNLNKVDSQKYAAELNKLHDTGKGLKKSFIVEYNVRNSSFDQIARGSMRSDIDNSDLPSFAKKNINNSYYFRLNETKQLNANYTREQIRNVDVACSDVNDIPEPPKLAPRLFIQMYVTENAVGKILQDVIGSSLSPIYSKRCEIETHLNSLIKMLEAN